MKKLKLIAVICVVLCAVVYLQCNLSKPADPRGSQYAGSATCIKCHSDVYHSYLHTAHYMATMEADVHNVHGSFLTDNTVTFTPTDKVVMEKKDGSLYQNYYVNGRLKESHRFDIVLGGVKGESYLYWNGNGLDQLPISYYTAANKWVLSPRYDPRVVNFNRIITARCLACHASYAADLADAPQKIVGAEQFDRSSLVLSVDCERCHGPAAKHVDFQTNNPSVKTAMFITNIISLPRARKIDLCGQCHSGNKSEMLRSTFWFKPGDTLAKFKLPGYESSANTSTLDVHGNQVQLLESSKCFINSNLDCNTCHDTHTNQRNNIAMFTQKCVACHSSVRHSFANSTNDRLVRTNCVQCHMPSLPSAVIVSHDLHNPSAGDIYITTHHITVYPEETKRILGMISSK